MQTLALHPSIFSGTDEGIQRGIAERARAILDTVAHMPRPEAIDFHRRAMYHAFARLATGHDEPTALVYLSQVNANSGNASMFFLHINIDAYLRFGHRYPDALKELVRERMMASTYEIGGTENHKVMIAVAGYLVGQTWPEWEGAAALQVRMYDYLQNYFARVVRYGQGEFDSSTYHTFYLSTMATLHDCALDPQVKRQAGMMLDWYLANMAGEWLQGQYAGAHSRDYAAAAGPEGAAPGTAGAWLYFGGRTPDLQRFGAEAHYLCINALSTYQMPTLLAHIAQDRSRPYVHRETHDLVRRHAMDCQERCCTNHRNQPAPRFQIDPTGEVTGYNYISRAGVWKYTYMTQAFALGSMFE